jgi:hypothetical protein
MFSTTIGEHLWLAFLAAWVLLFVVIKIVSVIDADGEIKKTANQGLAEWIKRRLK